MLAAQAILDRGYGKPHHTQSIDANINEDGGPVRYAEVPKKAEHGRSAAVAGGWWGWRVSAGWNPREPRKH
jgi:hypothetical protein